MLYTNAKFWKDNGVTWRSLSRIAPNGLVSDLIMGPLKEWEVERSIAWCKERGIRISDIRAYNEPKTTPVFTWEDHLRIESSK